MMQRMGMYGAVQFCISRVATEWRCSPLPAWTTPASPTAAIHRRRCPSILATDYPVDKYGCYLSDDAVALIYYEAMVETERFTELWVPFCRKHCIEPRAATSHFKGKARQYTWRALEEFVNDHRRVLREYECMMSSRWS